MGTLPSQKLQTPNPAFPLSSPPHSTTTVNASSPPSQRSAGRRPHGSRRPDSGHAAGRRDTRDYKQFRTHECASPIFVWKTLVGLRPEQRADTRRGSTSTPNVRSAGSPHPCDSGHHFSRPLCRVTGAPVTSDPTRYPTRDRPVDLVLGLSITSAAVRLVVVEGAAGEGDTVRHDTVDIDTLRTCDDARGLAELLLGKPLVEAALAGQVRSIGVSWTDNAAAEGSMVMQALAVAGFDNFIAVSERDAAAALARALQDLAGSDDIGVCVVEPEAVLVATVHSGKALAERITRPDNSIDELVGDLAPLLHPPGWTPEAIFALGSADDLDLVVASLRDEMPSSIVSAAEAEVAMARGAALAAAWAISGTDVQVVGVSEDVLAAGEDPRERDRRVHKLTTRVGVLTSVLVAAVVTFVVSVSAALGLGLTSETAPTAADQRAAAAAPATPANALPPAAPPSPQAPVPPAAPVAELRPPAPETVVAQSPPPPEAAPPSEVAIIEPAEAAPAPVYGPMEPAPPAAAPVEVPPDYVPPPYVAPQLQPQPRLRDRIIEKIPIINRFYEPKPQYPQ